MPAPLSRMRTFPVAWSSAGERLADDGRGHLAVGHRGGGGGDRQVVDLDGAVGHLGLRQRLNEEVLLHRALLDRHGLPLQLGHRLDRGAGRHHDVEGRDLGVGAHRGRHHLHGVAGRLGEDGGRLGHVAEVDGAPGLGRDDRRAADEVGPVDRVLGALERVRGREDRLVLLQLVAERDGHAGQRRGLGGPGTGGGGAGGAPSSARPASTVVAASRGAAWRRRRGARTRRVHGSGGFPSFGPPRRRR